MFVYIRMLWLISLITLVSVDLPLMLTSYINHNRTQEARRRSAVDPTLFLDKESYSGLLTVDERYNSNIFFWYFPAAVTFSNSTPWIIWLQGGPGASSLVGVFSEIGPFEYDATAKKLKERQYAWTNRYSVLFIDNPIGAGFSFTHSHRGFARNIQNCTAHLMEALRQFILMFPELTNAPLYIAGESYAGVYAPNLATEIHRQYKETKHLAVNLQGLILGSPVMDRVTASDYSSTYFKWGLIDIQGVAAARPLQRSYIEALEKKNARAAYELRGHLLNKLSQLSQRNQLMNVVQEEVMENIKSFIPFLKKPKIREALHVGNMKFYFTNNTSRFKLAPDFLAGGGLETAALLNNYRVLIYCGLYDMVIPCTTDSSHRRTTWNWNKLDEFLHAPRFPWWFQESVVGYSKSGGGFTEVVFLRAGHMAPMDNPAEVYSMVTSFIEGTPLSKHPEFEPISEDTPDIPEYNEQSTHEDKDYNKDCVNEKECFRVYINKIIVHSLFPSERTLGLLILFLLLVIWGFCQCLFLIRTIKIKVIIRTEVIL